MDGFTLRLDPSQLRGLRWFTLLLAAVTIVLVVSTTTSGGGWGGRLGEWTIAAGICTLISVYALVIYGLAYTECTPAGIRTRGLAGRRECRWAEVARIVPRPYRNTVTVVVVTTAGRRFRLGAPVAGGVMNDPQFPDKLARIQQYWQSADAMAGGGQAVGPA